MLAFPCNQFAYQELQAATEVEACVRRKYGVEFHMMQKVTLTLTLTLTLNPKPSP